MVIDDRIGGSWFWTILQCAHSAEKWYTQNRVKCITSSWNTCMYISDRDMYQVGDKYDLGDKII